MSITSKIYKGDDKIARLYKGDKKVLFMTRGNKVIYADWGPFTFNATGVVQTLTIPPLVSKIHVDCVASKGRDVTSGSYSARGGLGGRVQCDLAVQGGETLYIMVGDVPSDVSPSYNASDIRLSGNTLNDRIIVAGGGGWGIVSNRYAGRAVNGGNGGGLTGASTPNPDYGAGATGGTQTAGGTGATQTNGRYGTGQAGNGQFGLGGAGIIGGNDGTRITGAGGAGYYGGGGGVSWGIFLSGGEQGGWGTGGAGGSSYTNSNCSNVVHTQGYQDGAGYVTISFVE